MHAHTPFILSAHHSTLISTLTLTHSYSAHTTTFISIESTHTCILSAYDGPHSFILSAYHYIHLHRKLTHAYSAHMTAHTHSFPLSACHMTAILTLTLIHTQRILHKSLQPCYHRPFIRTLYRQTYPPHIVCRSPSISDCAYLCVFHFPHSLIQCPSLSLPLSEGENSGNVPTPIKFFFFIAL